MTAALAASPDSGREILDGGRAELATLIGAPDPGRVLFTTGCTSALSLAITDLPWQPGDAIVTSGLEHHALLRPVARLASLAGVLHRVVPPTPASAFDLAILEDVLCDGAVRLVACTMASNVTGAILPIRAISDRVHAAGALMLVDVAQTLGNVPVDVGDLGADILVVAGHKGLHGPTGVGALWASPEVVFDSPATACSVRHVPAPCAPFPSWCDTGSANLPAIAGLRAGIAWLSERGLDGIRRHTLELTARLLRGVAECDALRVVGPPDAEARTATVSLVHDRLAPRELAAALRPAGIVARAGLHCAPQAITSLGLDPAEGTLRLSFGPGVSSADVDAALVVLRRA